MNKDSETKQRRGEVAAQENLIPKNSGYRKLKSFQIAQLIYDVTVRFCDRYVDKFSRTKDQMVQAARSGVQNIAEGSQASGTSKKTELKLTNVARASLEELRLDYEDFLRQRELPVLSPENPALVRFKARRCSSLGEVRAWVADERARQRTANQHGRSRTNTDKRAEGRSFLSSTNMHMPSGVWLGVVINRRVASPHGRIAPSSSASMAYRAPLDAFW